MNHSISLPAAVALIVSAAWAALVASVGSGWGFHLLLLGTGAVVVAVICTLGWSIVAHVDRMSDRRVNYIARVVQGAEERAIVRHGHLVDAVFEVAEQVGIMRQNQLAADIQVTEQLDKMATKDQLDNTQEQILIGLAEALADMAATQTIVAETDRPKRASFMQVNGSHRPGRS